MKKYFISARVLLAIVAISTSIPVELFSQCRGFVKQQITLLPPFVSSGKISKAILQPGDHSELTFIFFAGQSYRIVMKSAKAMGDVIFFVKDANNHILFSNENEKNADHYDFTSETTQPLTVELLVPENNFLADATINGCVCVLVGCKE